MHRPEPNISMYKFATILLFFTVSIQSQLFFKDPYVTERQSDNTPRSYFIDTIRDSNTEVSSYCFIPDNQYIKMPVIFFCHGINETDYKTYSGLINHIVSEGYVLIYAPYKTVPLNNKQQDVYESLYKRFTFAVRKHLQVIDTSKTGFVSHSFGAGATPYISYRLLTINKWGNCGTFLYLMAPWYPCVITKKEFARYPSQVNLLMQVYNNDVINDPRIARGIYNQIGVSIANKRCMTVFSDSVPSFTITADHNFPCKKPEEMTIFHKNGLLRTFDLLSAMTFKNDTMARQILFPPSDTADIVLAQWRFGLNVKPALLSRYVPIYHPQNTYLNFWDHLINPLNDFNTHFNSPKPIFFTMRATARNYIQTFTNNKNKTPHKKDLPYSIPDTSFGSDGPYFSNKQIIPNPRIRTRSVKIYQPRNHTELSPVIFMSHSFFTANVKNYEGLIEHLVSRGYCVVFVNSIAVLLNTDIRFRYDVLMSGYLEAADLIKSKIDTTRIGFIGHGFSAGAFPAIAYDFVKNRNWGSNGSFLFLSEPWYMRNISSDELIAYPRDMQMIVELYEHDKYNDWRVGEDIFNAIHIPDSNKNLIILRSDKHGSYRLKSNIFTFCSHKKRAGRKRIDALDIYGVYRLIDALAESSFDKNPDARLVALGSNNAVQRYMGEWSDGTPIRELISTNRPDTVLTRKRHFWTYKSVFNKRNISSAKRNDH
jgi:hypothetical protein